MIKLQRWSTTPAGQVMVATVFFCFIFIALFTGVIKSGLIYNAKARAVRATDLTSLSAGAVYANGMQLVRLTNCILAGFLVIDLSVLMASLSLTGGLANFVLPKMPLTKLVQTVQRILFGVGMPTGAYPFLIFTESNNASKDNLLSNNWPNLNSWTLPTPPSPIYLFNYEGSLAQAFVPNMGLKFRTLDFFLFKIPKGDKPTRYYYREKKTGEIHYYNADKVVDARNPRFPNQKKVKVDDQWKWVALEKEGEKEAQEAEKALTDAEKKEEKGVIQKLKDKIPFFDIYKQIPIDVTDRDDPPNHTVMVVSSYPNSDGFKSAGSLTSISETSVEGSGLDATKINDPPYSAKLKSSDPATIAQYLNIQSMVQNVIHSGKLPSITDMFSLSAGGPTK